MALGMVGQHYDRFEEVVRFSKKTQPERLTDVALHRAPDGMFPAGSFADRLTDRGRRSVAQSAVAAVMVVQRMEGLSDRTAVERYSSDARWQCAAGVGGYDSGRSRRFAHTVLADMRERLRRSERPNRIFAIALGAGQAAGLVRWGRRLRDSAPLYDAVATMDTIPLIRSAVRSPLNVVDSGVAGELRAVLASGDDYPSSAKPQIDWDDSEAHEAQVDRRAKDGWAWLLLLNGRPLSALVAEAARLLAAVTGPAREEGSTLPSLEGSRL